MNVRKIFATAFCAGLVLVWAGTTHVLGCECKQRNDVETEATLAAVVFSGEVVAVDGGRPDAHITFRIGRVWKGEKVKELTIQTNNEGKACGFIFQKGENYLVYAYESDGLRTDICTRTRPSAYASDDITKLADEAWSPVVNGLRARLQVLPPDKAGVPFSRVFIEMENVSDAAGQRRIRFSRDRLRLKATNAATGKPLDRPSVIYDGFSPNWETTLLPYRGSIRFQISFPGAGYRPTDAAIIDLGPMDVWVIPADGEYLLSGSLLIPEQKGDHPYLDWSGTLELPAVRIPKRR